MQTSEIYKHRTLIGYFFATIRAGQVWRFSAKIIRYLRRVRLVRTIYFMIRAALLALQTGATFALFVAFMIAIVPLLFAFGIFLLVEQFAMYMRWRVVFRTIFSYDRICYVFFCEKVLRPSFLLSNAQCLSRAGGVVLLVLPFRKNNIIFRTVERIEESVFLINPGFYFYLRRKYLAKNHKKNVFVLSDFCISNRHYTTNEDEMSR